MCAYNVLTCWKVLYYVLQLLVVNFQNDLLLCVVSIKFYFRCFPLVVF